MKTKGLFVALMALIMCFVTGEAYAYDIEVENADGVTIYYNYFNEGRELEVTYGNGNNSYSVSVVIPEEVTFMNRTRKVTSIGYHAFYYCRSLTSVTIPGSVTSIGEGAFYDCRSLTSVTIPNSVTSIGNYAFEGCTGLTSVTIPNSVTSIGDGAFYGCRGLTSVTIPNSVTSIGVSAFRFCSGLTSVTIPNSVTSIGGGAFYGCSGLTSVTIPNSVTSIGFEAFDGCSGLTSVHITDLAAWCKISFSDYSSNPLYYAHHLYLNNQEITDLVIPDGMTSIGNYAFEGCTGLTSVTIPNSVTSIGDGAFYGCTGLTSVTIPNSVTSIGVSAFRFCSGLTSVTIPNSVTSIGNSAFAGCTGLTSVTIPNSVTSIGDWAFEGCTGLTSVTIPNSVTSIGRSAFDGYYLESVISLIEEPFAIRGKASSDTRTFSLNTFNNATLYVPVGTIDKYKATDGWKDFANIVEMESSDEGVWLSIVDAEQGRTKLKCETGKSYTFRFEAADGWHVHSVTYRGSDVTDWLKEDGEFTTPAMRTSVELIVTYEQGTTAVKAFADESAMRVVVIDGEIVVKNAEAGTPIRVYDLSGKLIGNTTAAEGATKVNVAAAAEKVVVVKVGERSVKVRR